MAVTWKLKPILEKYGITPYRLIMQTGIAATSIYRITAHDPVNIVTGKTLDRILTGLWELTGEKFQVQDLLEWQPDTPGTDDG